VKRLCVEFDAETRNVLTADNLALDPSNPHLQDFIKLYEKHAGHPITLSKAHGGSDARFFAVKGIPVIMLRPDGTGAHADTETLSVDSLNQFYLLLEEYALKNAAPKHRSFD
jgi:di/tripeptidase